MCEDCCERNTNTERILRTSSINIDGFFLQQTGLVILIARLQVPTTIKVSLVRIKLKVHSVKQVTSMEQSRARASGVAPPKKKKKPGALTGKSVVVLKHCDVIVRDGTVFMPNTVGMAQLKKAEKGQFKTNVQISSKMTETDIKKILVETFPFLKYQR